MCSAGALASAALEFRSDDSAWYNATVKLEGDALRVSYCEFAGDHDHVFSANEFLTLSELSDFEARFRPLSRQFQDPECPNLDPGLPVCASYSSRPDDVRFFDAVVDGVDYLEHSFANGEEECLCNFILFWQHGPISGDLTTASIADMCEIQFGEMNDTVLATFFRKVRDKIQTRMNRGDTCSEGHTPIHDGLKDSCRPTLKRRQCFFQRMKQETRRAKRSSGTLELCEDHQTLAPRYSVAIEQDTDIGGINYQHMILLENVDKGLSPVKLARFLQGQTSILPRVYIFPALTFESYARGAIVLNCRKNLEKLCDFLDNPDHVIVSSQGRPLIVTGNLARQETFGTLAAGAMVLDSEDKFCNERYGSVCCELKAVKAGTKEYSTAKHMKELFMEFLSHQRRLHQRLAME